MSNEFAAPDYEPTAAEIDEWLASWDADPPRPGQHGEATIILGFERYIWHIPVFWGHRQVNPNGSISLSWCVPAPCPHDDES